MSVTTQGSPQRSPHSPREEPGTAGASARGAAGSVASGQASGLPHIEPHNALDEAPSKTTTTRFLYDALHRRLGRVKDNGEVTVFVYEGWNVIAEKTLRTAGSLEPDTEIVNLETRYTWGEDLSGTLQGAGGIGGLLSSVQAGSLTKNEAPRTTNVFHYDSNGNVILLTDGLGRETGRYAYDAFGKTLTATGPAARMNRYRFSTKLVESESGLVYYGYRYYDPVTGRWPSRDPIGEQGGAHLYVVANNRLTYSVDVMGLTDPIISCGAGCTGQSGLSGHNHEIRYTRTKTCTLEWFRRVEGGGVTSPIDLNWYEHPAGNQCDNWDESGRPDGPGGVNSDCNVTSERVVSAGASSIEWVLDEMFRRKWKWIQDETVQLKFCCTFP